MLKNLTPHVLNILCEDGNWKNLPTDGPPARCSVTPHKVFTIEGVQVNKTTFDRIVDLPEPMAETLLVVSRIVKEACPERSDLLCAGEMIRDKEGKVVGCRGLSI